MKRNYLLILVVMIALFNQVINAADSVVVWKYKTNGKIYSSPVIRNNIIYIGSNDGNFYAINRETGSEIWKYETGLQIRTTAVIFDTIICFGSGNKLIGLNLDGDSLWSFQLYSGNVIDEHDAWDHFNSSPLLVDTIAYIGSEQGMVYGVDVRTGEMIFDYQTPTPAYTIEIRPAVHEGKIYFGDWDGVFYCVDLATKTLVWDYDTKEDNTYAAWVNAILTDPVILNDSVYFAGRSCNLYCMNTETGAVNWQYHDPQDMWLLGGPVIDDTMMYMGSSNQHIVQGFSINGDQRLWNYPTDYRVFGTPWFDDNLLIFGTGNENADKVGSMYILDKFTHELKEKFRAKGQVFSSPQVIDSIIYFSSADSNVYAVHLGELLRIKRPHSFLKETSKAFGTLTGVDEVTDSIYIYNDGEGPDSISLDQKSSYITLDPANFLLAPGDSQKVSVLIDVSQLTAKIYYTTLSFDSNLGREYTKLTKQYSFEILTSLNESTDKQGIAMVQNFPNPFSESTTFRINLREPDEVQLSILDITGREVIIYTDKKISAGTYDFQIDCTGLPEGVYVYRLRTSDGIFTNKMIKNN